MAGCTCLEYFIEDSLNLTAIMFIAHVIEINTFITHCMCIHSIITNVLTCFCKVHNCVLYTYICR